MAASPPEEDVQTKKERFVEAHLNDAQKGADDLGVPIENILGLSAQESGWGKKNRFTREGNNYFSLHHPAPFTTGWMLNLDGSVKVSTFDSYAESLKSLTSRFGDLMRNKADPEEFARILQDIGAYGINRDGTKVLSFVHETALTIKGLRPVIERVKDRRKRTG